MKTKPTPAIPPDIKAANRRRALELVAQAPPLTATQRQTIERVIVRRIREAAQQEAS